jgi:hypothetical protein
MTKENRQWWLRRRCNSRLLVGSDAHCQAGGCRLKKSEEGRKVATPVSVGTTAGSGSRSRSRPACPSLRF